jgi:hypothetical protein
MTLYVRNRFFIMICMTKYGNNNYIFLFNYFTVLIKFSKNVFVIIYTLIKNIYG